MTSALPLRLLIATALSAVLVSGCTSHRSSAASPLDSPATTSSAAASASDTASSSTDSSPASTTTTPLSSSPAAGSSTALRLPTCGTGQLRLTAQRGSSVSQQTFATLILTNHGPSCATAGFPGVSLLRTGQQIGPAATRLRQSYHTLDLPSGASAHAQFTISTACNADRSDTVRVYPPDQTTPLTMPLSVFACASTIGPLQPGL